MMARHSARAVVAMGCLLLIVLPLFFLGFAYGYEALVMATPFRRGLEVMRDATAAVLKSASCDVHLIRREGQAPPA